MTDSSQHGNSTVLVDESNDEELKHPIYAQTHFTVKAYMEQYDTS